MRSGGAVVREWLESAGIDHFFNVPGETFLPILDELRDSQVTVVTCRHESGASFAATAYARFGRRLGVCMGTRGPGASNLAIGLHTAYYEAVPLVVLIGQVPRSVTDSFAFQEVDMKSLYGPIAKQVLYVSDPEALPGVLRQAEITALSDRPGPVVVTIPQDVLSTEVAAPTPPRAKLQRPREVDTGTVSSVLVQLQRAHRPLVLSAVDWNDAERDELVRVIAAMGLPVVNAWRYYSSTPNDHDNFCGNLGLGAPKAVDAALAEADFILGLGPVLEDVNMGGGAKLNPHGFITVVSPYTDAAGLRRTGSAEVNLIAADPAALVAGLATWLDRQGAADASSAASGSAGSGSRSASPDSAREMRARFASYTQDLHSRTTAASGDEERKTDERKASGDAAETRSVERVQSTVGRDRRMEDEDGAGGGHDSVDKAGLFRMLDAVIPSHAVVVSDAGNFAQWLLRHLRFGERKFVGPVNGAMGYGLPGGIGVQLVAPDRPVWTIAGDGGLLMTAGEMNTAVRHGLNLVCVVVNNSVFGTIRAHQERHYPGRTVGTHLGDVDFAAVARGMGWQAWSVTRNEDLPAALEAVRNATGCRLIDVRVEENPLSVGE